MNATYRMLLVLAVVLAWFAPTAHARWYDPSTGRWLQRDPARFINGMNQYQYVVSNPIRFVDSTGRAAEEPPDGKAKDPADDVYNDPNRGCGIKVKQNRVGNGYGHRWIEIGEPGKPTRSLGFYPSGSKLGKDKGSWSAFGGKGVWMSPNADEKDSTDKCACAKQNDPANGQPGDSSWGVEPSHDKTWELNPSAYGNSQNDGEYVLRPKRLGFGKGKDKGVLPYPGDFWQPDPVQGATCDEIRDCLDRFQPDSRYFWGGNDCRDIVDLALSACGLKRK